MRTKLIVFILCIVLVCHWLPVRLETMRTNSEVTRLQNLRNPEPTPVLSLRTANATTYNRARTGKYAEGILDENNGITFIWTRKILQSLPDFTLIGFLCEHSVFPTTTFDHSCQIVPGHNRAVIR